MAGNQSAQAVDVREQYFFIASAFWLQFGDAQSDSPRWKGTIIRSQVDRVFNRNISFPYPPFKLHVILTVRETRFFGESNKKTKTFEKPSWWIMLNRAGMSAWFTLTFTEALVEGEDGNRPCTGWDLLDFLVQKQRTTTQYDCSSTIVSCGCFLKW